MFRCPFVILSLLILHRESAFNKEKVLFKAFSGHCATSQRFVDSSRHYSCSTTNNWWMVRVHPILGPGDCTVRDGLAWRNTQIWSEECGVLVARYWTSDQMIVILFLRPAAFFTLAAAGLGWAGGRRWCRWLSLLKGARHRAIRSASFLPCRYSHLQLMEVTYTNHHFRQSVELQTKVHTMVRNHGKGPTRTFSWLKEPTSAFTFKTLC